MKLLVALGLLAFAAVAEAGVSVNNPFYCYASDFVRPQVELHSVRTSYEAVRRTSVNTAVSSEFSRIYTESGSHEEAYVLIIFSLL